MKKSVFIKQIVIICVLAIALFSMTGCEELNVHIFGNHTYTTEVTEPTCTEQGYTTYICSCGYTYVDDYTNALGHAEVVDKAVTPTCTEAGLTEGKHCSVCETVIVAQEVVPSGHTYGEPEIITNADCFNNGEQKLSCESCDYEEIQIINKLEHEFALVEGTELNQCTLCGVFEFGGHFYKIFDIDTTWTGAKEYCENLGGHSVTITSQEENDFINALRELSAFNHYFLGGFKENGVWVWITGEEFVYTCWASGEPNNSGSGEYYLETRGAWNDTIHAGQDNTNTGIICEWEPEE